jgi:FkbM family methyltransferase
MARDLGIAAVDLIKVDVEGGELAVFQGLRTTRPASAPGRVVRNLRRACVDVGPLRQ